MIITRYSCLMRGALWTIYIRILGGKVGRHLMADRGVTFRYLPHKGIFIGDDVYLGRGVVIDVNRQAKLHLGTLSLIAHFSVISASKSIWVGEGTQIGESCSIRDSDHGMKPDATIRSQPLTSEEVILDDDVWIGRGSAVLRGSRVGRGSVVGANSLIKGDVPPGMVVAGTPWVAIRTR